MDVRDVQIILRTFRSDAPVVISTVMFYADKQLLVFTLLHRRRSFRPSVICGLRV